MCFSLENYKTDALHTYIHMMIINAVNEFKSYRLADSKADDWLTNRIKSFKCGWSGKLSR